ncbi:Na+-transporting methylmalonyl-CoA/oxaloacetate decarboxylase gamma subunit [Metabacillus crassostreae]|uniref:hypothetical protein n=1 Tax=Metabacillus crassostreae TaxID=929098 RepID=UPI00195862F5|nr:hypothetical protein [Metabacillus crassostreae]MBM7604851.1 Na+-transporting methylmalonyl-CoA/oxaloacetate decarboxylase gamma subunit [Metabacillus crassostreae]
MNNLTIILIGMGLVLLLLSLILLISKIVKKNLGISKGMVALLLTGFVFIIAGIGLMLPNLKEKITSEVPKEVSVDTTIENSNHNEAEVVNNEIEPQRIARNLVKIEMAKQVGLKNWEITENRVTSDQIVNNIADYDKPVGDKRIVWVSGNVKATSEDGITGNVGYELELYQMKDDDKWYIGKHMGVLIDLEVTEKPLVEEDEKYFSNSEELPIPEEASQPEEEKSINAGNEEFEFVETDLLGAWHWDDGEDFYMILRDDFTYSYIEEKAGFVSEGTYTIEKVNNQFKVTVQYITGENKSIMLIDLIDKNHLEGNEDGYSWKASRMNPEEAEGILNKIK